MARRLKPRHRFVSRIEAELLYVRLERALIWLLLGLLVVHLLDAYAWRFLTVTDSDRLKTRDWYQVLRQMGYLPVWVGIGLAYGFSDLYARRRGAQNAGPRAVLLILSPVVAGLVAEVCKRMIGRGRPPEFPVATEADPIPAWPDLGYVYRPFLEGWTNDTNLGIPSSHAAVAFGGLVMLGLMHRGARWIFWVLALGCGMSRVVVGAHWLSDVYAGGVIGALSAIWLWRRFGARWSRDASDLCVARGGRLG